MAYKGSLVGVGLLLASTADGFAPGGNNPGPISKTTPVASSASVVDLRGGTQTPIKAIREGEPKLKDIESVWNLEEFELAVRRPKQVVAVWFQASWCRKCKYIGTRLKRLDEHLPAYLTNNLVLVSLDVNKVAEVPQRQKIKDLPTIQFFVEGEMVGSYVATDRGDAFYENMEKRLRVAMGEDVE